MIAPCSGLLGVSEEEQRFLLETYLPLLQEEVTGRYQLTVLEKAELVENTVGTVSKLLFAFLWQEGFIDTNGVNEIPEVNEAGAAFLPKFNMFFNNMTLWDLNVQAKWFTVEVRESFLCHKETAKGKKYPEKWGLVALSCVFMT